MGRSPPTADGANVQGPVVLTGVTQEMRIAREEVFGPFASVIRFDTETQALQIANATEYGLAAYVFTRSLDRLFRVSEALKVGMVGFNTGSVSNEAGPFGGVKESGYGREGSKYGLDDYVDIRQIVVRLDRPSGGL